MGNGYATSAVTASTAATAPFDLPLPFDTFVFTTFSLDDDDADADADRPAINSDIHPSHSSLSRPYRIMHSDITLCPTSEYIDSMHFLIDDDIFHFTLLCFLLFALLIQLLYFYFTYFTFYSIFFTLYTLLYFT